MNTEAPYLVWETHGNVRLSLQATTTLGRLPENMLPLEDAGCSGRHAIIRSEGGRWVLEDLGSTNGTWVNGQRISAPHILREGDRIQMGSQLLRAAGLEAHCQNCGWQRLPQAAFCPGCGLSFAPPPASARPLPPPPPAPMPLPPPVPTPLPPTRKGERTILFWVLFVLLALFGLLLLLAGGNLLFGGFLLLLSILILALKRFLSRSLPRALLGFGVAGFTMALAFVATGGGERRPEAFDGLVAHQSGEVSVFLPEWTLPEGARPEVRRDDNPPAAPAGSDADFQAYDITLPEGAELEGVAEIHLPFDRNLLPGGTAPEDAVGAAYYDPQRQAWEPVPCTVDSERSRVSI